MPWETGIAHGHSDLFDKLRRFVTGRGVVSNQAFVGTGNGSLDIDANFGASLTAVTESWTIACTDATTPGSEVWSVTGSVSGVQAAATTGVTYDNGLLAFTIVAGGINYAVADQYTLDVTEGAMKAANQVYEELALEDVSAIDRSVYLKAKGLTGTDEIYLQLRHFQDAGADWYNWELAGALNYSAQESWSTQFNVSGNQYLTLTNADMTYWFIANGRRVIIVAKVSTVYVAAYLGWYLPYATPTEFPYPAFIGANHGTWNTRWSSANFNNSNFWNPTTNAASLRHIDGQWLRIRNRFQSGGESFDSIHNVWPWENIPHFNFESVRNDLSSGYALYPAILHSAHEGANVYGELDGVFAVSGFGNFSEDTITVGGDTYLVVQSVHHTGRGDYAALKLE